MRGTVLTKQLIRSPSSRRASYVLTCAFTGAQKKELLSKLYIASRGPKFVDQNVAELAGSSPLHQTPGVNDAAHATDLTDLYGNAVTSVTSLAPSRSVEKVLAPVPGGLLQNVTPAPQHQHGGMDANAVAYQAQVNPSKLAFNFMYEQLRYWHEQYKSCVIPRSCGDAVVLGTWVRHMRRMHKKGTLQQWKIDQLSLLGFQWNLSDADAKWHNMFHELRRFKSLHGHTRVPTRFSSPADKEWMMLSR